MGDSPSAASYTQREEPAAHVSRPKNGRSSATWKPPWRPPPQGMGRAGFCCPQGHQSPPRSAALAGGSFASVAGGEEGPPKEGTVLRGRETVPGHLCWTAGSLHRVLRQLVPSSFRSDIPTVHCQCERRRSRQNHPSLRSLSGAKTPCPLTAQEAPGSRLIPSTPDECSLLRLPCVFTVMTFPTQEGPSDRLPNLDAVLG